MIMDPSILQINLQTWKKVEQPEPVTYPYILSATPSGHLSLGRRLKEAMKETSPDLIFNFYLEPGGKTLALIPAKDGEYQFPKGGRIKDVAFTRELVNAGIPLVARYHVGWNEKAGAWVGVLAKCGVETTGDTALRESLKRREKGRKKGEK